MTLEERQLITPDEIKAIEFECHKCHTRVAIPIAGTSALPHKCPHCGDAWRTSDTLDTQFIHSTVFKSLASLREALQNVTENRVTKEPLKDIIGCAIRFELRAPVGK